MLVTPFPMFTSSIIFVQTEIRFELDSDPDFPIMLFGNDIVPLTTSNVIVYVCGYDDEEY